MKCSCVIGKMREICKITDSYISKRIKEEKLPILKNHIPLFYILSENGDYMLFNELASNWNISKSSLSDILAKYQDLGLIKKCECFEDKRSVYISLTAEAIVIKEKLKTIEEEILNQLLHDFQKKELEIFENNIDKALSNGKRIL